MGKSDIAVKQWLKNKHRFADLFNGVIFQGEQVVRPEELEEINSESGAIVPNKEEMTKGIQKFRDIVMKWKQGPDLAILACENQDKVHYAMPVRVLLYDGLLYAEQIRQLWKERNPEEHVTKEEYLSRFKKEDKLNPIISIVFYYGKEPWDACTDLYGLFPQEMMLEKKKILESFLPNYKINLIDVGDLSGLERFHSDLQLVFGMLQYKRKKTGIREYLEAHKNYFEQIDLETYYAMSALLHSEKHLKELADSSSGKETINMCEALEAIYNDGLNKGMEEGIEKGILSLIKLCKEFGISKEETLSRIVDEFSVAKETAENYLTKAF